MRLVVIILSTLVLSSCTVLQVGNIDPRTGHFSANSTAQTLLARPFDIDARRARLLVAKDEFTVGQVRSIGYFTEVVTTEDLERRIIQNNLSDKVASLQNRIGINAAARFDRPFLWLHYEKRGSNQFGQYIQLILTDPLTMDDLFIAEAHLDYVWVGVNDQNTFYPLFNSLIDYIRKNSKTYR